VLNVFSHEYRESWLALAFVAALFGACILIFPTQQNQSAYGNPETRAAEVDSQIAPDERLADSTRGVEWFTAVLALVSMFQGYFLYRSDRKLQATIELANAYRISMQRPKIIIRNMHLPSGVQPGFDLDAVFFYYNVGDTTAEILAIEAEIFLLDKRGLIPTNRALIACNILKTKLICGDFGIAQISRSNVTAAEGETLAKGDARVCCIGSILYTDEIGKVQRRTGFVRTYNFVTGRFSPLDDSEYEYSY